MPTLYLHLYVDPTVALARGAVDAGKYAVTLMQSDVATLADDERKLLATYVSTEQTPSDKQPRLQVTSASSLDHLKGALRGILDADRIEAEKKAKQQAEAVARIDAILAKPDDTVEWRENNAAGKRWLAKSRYELLTDLNNYSEKEKTRLETFAENEAKKRNAADAQSYEAQLLDEPVETQLARVHGEWFVRSDVIQYLYPRAFARAAAEAEKRKAAAEEAKQAAKAAAEARKEESEARFFAVLRKVLSPEQLERAEATVLPVVERDNVVRDWLFASFDAQLARYAPIGSKELLHDEECEWGNATVEVEDYESFEEALYADAETWAGVKTVRALVASYQEMYPTWPTTLLYREHVMSCASCAAKKIERIGVKVTIEVEGHSYSREYGLPLRKPTAA